MLAIVHGCENFHHYNFGQPQVTVESDHKPLKILFKKKKKKHAVSVFVTITTDEAELAEVCNCGQEHAWKRTASS